MKSRIDSIRENMSLLSDEDLVLILTENADEYKPIALKIAQEELDSRNIDIDEFLERKKIQDLLEESAPETSSSGDDISVTETVPFLEVVQKAFYPLVEKHLRLAHPEDDEFLGHYREFYDKLLQITPTIRRNMLITLKKEKMYTDGPSVYFWHVYGLHTDQNVLLKLDDCCWSDWLGLHVLLQDLERIGHEAFVAHCFYKMTEKGFTEEEAEDNEASLEEQEGEQEDQY